ncbi:MAG: HD domain-containing protein [Vulcanimicrobiaceae bacterium]
MRRTIVAFVLLCMFAWSAVAYADSTPASATGIPLDAPWKVKIYQLARTSFKHPAWGWQHCERNYRVGLRLAQGDGLNIDTDVLFAAAFLHDMAAFPPYAQKSIEHGDRAAQTSEAVLRGAGFPMQKFAAVAAAERGHMYYRDPGKSPEAIVLHDADSLDFLGTIGEARMLSLTGESAPDFGPAVKALREFLTAIPPKLITKTAKEIGSKRVAELQRELDELQSETFDGAVM